MKESLFRLHIMRRESIMMTFRGSNISLLLLDMNNSGMDGSLPHSEVILYFYPFLSRFSSRDLSFMGCGAIWKERNILILSDRRIYPESVYPVPFTENVF